MVKRYNLKMLALVVSLAGILFVQEEVLTFIPNFQFTFLLIACYGATMGIKYGLPIIGIHVILDNIVMGSFNFAIMIPQAIGLTITLIFGYLFRNKNEYIVASSIALTALLYCYIYIPFNLCFFNIDFIPYIIADIPYEIILVVTSFITVLFLYKPIVKTINKLMVNMFNREPINNIPYEIENIEGIEKENENS